MQKSIRSTTWAATAAFTLALGAMGAAQAAAPETIQHRIRDAHQGAAAPTAGSTGQQTPVITYHGGPLMGTPNVYVIWYGNWNQTNGSDNAAGQQIVRDFLSNLGGSAYYKINATYGGTPTGNLNFIAGSWETSDSSFGTRLSDAKVQSVVSNALTSKRLPTDANGIYLVVSSSDVSESSGFCTRYCGWHTAAALNGVKVKYAFVGNANRCLSSCAAQSVGPNGNAGIDGSVSVIAHELEEANTDPEPSTGWADANGAENADKCAWTFGSAQKQAANGAYYNMTLGSRNYLVQRNLDATTSKCYLSATQQ